MSHSPAPQAGPLVLVGPVPPPYTGQSVAFGMLMEEVEAARIPHTVVNLAQAGEGGDGQFSRGRAREYAGILSRYARAAAGGRKTVYITIAQSRAGFARDFVMVWLAALFGHRVVLHLHGGNYPTFYAQQPPLVQRIVRATLRRASRLLVLGERLRSSFDFDPALPPRVAVVVNGLPDEMCTAVAPRRLPAPGEGPVRLLYLSNLVESKGWMHVLQAARLLRDRMGEDAVRVDFYGAFFANADDDRVNGAAHARRMFEDYVREHGLEPCVAWHGVVTGEAKRAVLGRSHFFLLPTNYNNEGQPVSIIEAMASGNVVISTDYRAIPDMVDDGVSGRLVPFADPEAIADAVQECMRDPERYTAMSAAAIDLYRRRFTRRAHLDALMRHLTETGRGSSLPGATEARTQAPVPGS